MLYILYQYISKKVHIDQKDKHTAIKITNKTPYYKSQLKSVKLKYETTCRRSTRIGFAVLPGWIHLIPLSSIQCIQLSILNPIYTNLMSTSNIADII